MTDTMRLAEEHILAHEARLKHLDELVERVRAGAGDLPEYAHVHTELKGLIGERDKLAVQVDDVKARAAADWEQHQVERAGPMALWDVVAQQLEKLVEKVERP